jgi:wyosine [tRNA(Phe)-imidazoG37] synthetase (radical SAM superfamily)
MSKETKYKGIMANEEEQQLARELDSIDFNAVQVDSPLENEKLFQIMKRLDTMDRGRMTRLILRLVEVRGIQRDIQIGGGREFMLGADAFAVMDLVNPKTEGVTTLL